MRLKMLAFMALLLALPLLTRAQDAQEVLRQIEEADKNTIIELSEDLEMTGVLRNAHGAEITLQGVAEQPVRLYGLSIDRGTFYIDNAAVLPLQRGGEDEAALTIHGEADVTIRHNATVQGDVSLASEETVFFRCYGDVAGTVNATGGAGAQINVVNPGRIGRLSLHGRDAWLHFSNTGLVEEGVYLSASGSEGGVTLNNAQEAVIAGSVTCRANHYRGGYAAVTIENEGRIEGGVESAGTAVLVDYGQVQGGIRTRRGERAEGFIYVYLPRVSPDDARTRARACHIAYKHYQVDPRDVCFRFE